MIKPFLCNSRDFMGIYWIINTLFFWPRTAAARLGRSTGRSTVPCSRSTVGSTDVHGYVHAGCPMSRSTARSTD